MISEAIQKILDISKVQEISVGDRLYTSRPVTKINPPLIDPLVVHSLQAVVDYFAPPKVEMLPEESLIQVVNEGQVAVFEALADKSHRTREHFLTARRGYQPFEFGAWMDQERAVIALLTQFERTPERDEVLKVVSGLVVANENKITDNGISQEVQVRQGIGRIEKVEISNPIKLRPFRAFLEVEQPESPHVLRVKNINGVPHVALFEAGDAWRVEAVEKIKAWLKERLPDAKVIG